MALNLRFRLRRRVTGSDAPPPDHLQGELAASEPGDAFYYGYGNGAGDLAAESRLMLRSDGVRLWHDKIGAADGSTEFEGDGTALRGVATRWAEIRSPLDFGAIGDDTTDDTAAWQAALTWCAAVPGRRISDRSGRTYRITSTLSAVGDVSIVGDCTLRGDFDGRILELIAPVAAESTLSADYVPGSTTLAVTGLPSAPSPGSWIKLFSRRAVNPNSRDRGPVSGPESSRPRCGIWVQVGFGSTTTSIVLMRPIPYVVGIDPYAAGTGDRVLAWSTAMLASVAIPQPMRFEMEGVKFTQTAGNDASWNGALVILSGIINPTIRRCAADGGYGPALSLGGTVNALVEACDFRNLRSDPSKNQYGYGVHDTGHGTRVIGLTGSNCRHVYTTGQTTANETFTNPETIWRIGSTDNPVVAFADVSGGDNRAWADGGRLILAPLDTHHGCRGAQFIGCTVRDAGNGLNNRGQDTLVNGLVCRNVDTAIMSFSERQDGDAYPITAGKLLEDFASMRVIGLDAETRLTAIYSRTALLEVISPSVRTCCRTVVSGTGIVNIGGAGQIVIDTLDGAATGVVNGEDGVPGVLAYKANLEPDRTILGQPTIRLLPGASLRIDNRVAGPGGALNRLVSPITSAGAPDPYGRVLVYGHLHIDLPDDGTLWGATANVACLDGGLITFSRGAGTPSGAASNVGSLPVRVQATDGSYYVDQTAVGPSTLADYRITDGVTTGDSRLTDAREWTADTVAQAEAEAGTATTRRAWTAQRVFQAIAAWWAASAAKTKLDGIATGATANSADATLLARANHTGTQAASTITGLAAVATSGAYADLSGKPTLFDGTWSSLTGKPSTFAPSAHTHPASEISDSTAAGRALLTGADAAAQRTTLGLGTAAVASVTTSATDTTAGRVLRVGDSATILSASPALRATVGGTANAITLTTGASLPSLPTGLLLRWRAGSANTGSATINVDGLGAQACVTVTGAALPSGYIRTDVDTVAIWDGTNWQVQREAEAGSNADGEWVRLANGWQECTRIVDLDGISLTTAYGALYRNPSNLGPYAFPAAFANASAVYHVSIAISGSDNSAIRTGVVCGRTRRAQTTKGFAWDGIALLCATSATGTAGEITRISLSATGRWY